jgi:hypothetical protein
MNGELVFEKLDSLLQGVQSILHGSAVHDVFHSMFNR